MKLLEKSQSYRRATARAASTARRQTA
jgi:hypothetical protein